MKKLFTLFVSLFVLGLANVSADDHDLGNTSSYWNTTDDEGTITYSVVASVDDDGVQTINFTNAWQAAGWSWWGEDGPKDLSAYESIEIVLTSYLVGQLKIYVQYGESSYTEELSTPVISAGGNTGVTETLTINLDDDKKSAVRQIMIQSSAAGSIVLQSATAKADEVSTSATDATYAIIGTPNNIGTDYNSYSDGVITFGSPWYGCGWWYGDLDLSSCNAIEAYLTSDTDCRLKLIVQYADYTNSYIEQTVTAKNEAHLLVALDADEKSDVMQIYLQRTYAGGDEWDDDTSNWKTNNVTVTIGSIQAVTTECTTLYAGTYGGITFCNTDETLLDFSNAIGDAKAYYVDSNGVSEGVVTLTKFEGYAGSSTGLLIYLDEYTDATMTVYSASEATETILANNLLTPGTGDALEYGYILNYKTTYTDDSNTTVDSYNLGFYNGKGKTVAKGKAWLAYNSEENSSKGLSIVFPGESDDETTGISEVVTSAPAVEDNVYYNLSGMRVNTPSKGIYIVNGKKVIMK